MTTSAASVPADRLPLSGVRVVEFSQMIMGPCCGFILAELGAEVIKIEPLPRGDRTRYLPGLAAGFFTAFNRNKKSIALDTRDPRGLEVARKLIATADVMLENFRPGMMGDMGLDYASVARLNKRIVYCSLKGFLPGPYEKRTALDEIVQMMGGLGVHDRTARQADARRRVGERHHGRDVRRHRHSGALRERETTGRGQEVQAALFENNVFLMAQAMLAEAITGEPSEPWSVKERPWAVYDAFDTADGTKLFFAVVGDGQWKDFCVEFGRSEWLNDPRLATNTDRSAARPWLLPMIAALIAERSADELSAIFERLGLPFAPIRSPDELADDPHLNQSGGLVEITLPNGGKAKAPTLPITLDGRRLRFQSDPPKVGADTSDLLRDIGMDDAAIEQLIADGVAACDIVDNRKSPATAELTT